jgi:16S rRNA (uracil1498-N3)-methyltransferase
MPRLFLLPEQFSGDMALISGPDHLHLARVLRCRPGDKVILLDNAGNAFQAVLVTIGKTQTEAAIQGRLGDMPSEPPVFITVAQALGKGDRFEQVLQHGTEVGASAFLPLRTARCVVDVPAARMAERVGRWRQIVRGAAEQSGRTRLPEVFAPIPFAELLRRATQTEALTLLLHPDTSAMPLRTVLRALPEPPKRLILAVGPEGGWSPAEVSAARTANVKSIAIGAYVLRTETAALVAISQILYELET